MPRVAFRNFTGGEVSPSLGARYDLQKFGTFAQCMQNFVPNIHGDVERRPGTAFLADLGGACVLLPFQYNSEAANNFVLAFSDSQIRVFDADGALCGTMASPYALDDVPMLSTKQVGKFVYIAHRNYALRKISWDGGSSWNIQTVALNQSLAAPGKPTVTWHRGPKNSDSSDEYTKNETYKLSYQVTAVNSDGVESVASQAGDVTGRYPTDWVEGDHATIAWTAVSGATEYNIYRDSAGYYGFIGTSKTTSFRDDNFEPDTATTPKENWDPFADGNNPSAVALHQQRLVLAGTKNSPASVYMSRTGDYENFRKSRPLQDDDPVEYMLASGSIDDIQWVDSFGDILIGTSGAEYKMSASGAAITPSDCQISTQSYWGSSSVQPLIIGNSVIHCQRADSHIRDLYYSWEHDGYNGNDLSLLAPQLLETHKVRQMVFQQSPGSNIWIVRDDGVLLCLTYMQEQKIYGWSRHVTDGRVRSVCSICGIREDVVIMVVERVVNGTTKFFLERLMERFKDTDPIEDAWYVDCGVRRTPEADSDGNLVIVSGLGHLEDKTVSVLSDGAPEEHVVSDGKITLTYPARKALVGLGYASVLSPLPVESETDNGSTLGKRRTYGRVVLRLYRSVGGKWAGTGPGDLFDVDGWKQRTLYDVPFMPDIWGQAVQPFSGDVEVTMGQESHMDNDSSIWIVQDRPLPFRLVALMCDVDFGEM